MFACLFVFFFLKMVWTWIWRFQLYYLFIYFGTLDHFNCFLFMILMRYTFGPLQNLHWVGLKLLAYSVENGTNSMFMCRRGCFSFASWLRDKFSLEILKHCSTITSNFRFSGCLTLTSFAVWFHTCCLVSFRIREKESAPFFV